MRHSHTFRSATYCRGRTGAARRPIWPSARKANIEIVQAEASKCRLR